MDGQFARRPHNPAFEVIYVYSQQEGSLDLNFRGPRRAVDPLQGMFATTILKLPELPPDPKDERVYDLNLLRQPGFEFVYDGGSGIQDVVVKKLRRSSRVTKGDRITLEADTANNPKAVYDLLAQLGRAVPLHLYNVTQVELSASVMTEASKPPKKVTIRITHPNSCSLKIRRAGPDASGHAARLRDRTEGARRADRDRRRRAWGRGVTPRDALIELLERVSARHGRDGADQRGRTPPVASGSRDCHAFASAPRAGASRGRRGLSRLRRGLRHAGADDAGGTAKCDAVHRL